MRFCSDYICWISSGRISGKNQCTMILTNHSLSKTMMKRKTWAVCHNNQISRFIQPLGFYANQIWKRNRILSAWQHSFEFHENDVVEWKFLINDWLQLKMKMTHLWRTKTPYSIISISKWRGKQKNIAWKIAQFVWNWWCHKMRWIS